MTLLVGLDNPHSRDPRFALYPAPAGCAGYRLHHFIATEASANHRYSRAQYLKDFDRVNLYPSGRAKNGKGATEMDRAMGSWVVMYADQGEHRAVVLFGERVRLAVNHLVELVPEEGEDIAFAEHQGASGTIIFCSMPHPSGRNHWYNDVEHKQLAGRILAGFRREDMDL